MSPRICFPTSLHGSVHDGSLPEICEPSTLLHPMAETLPTIFVSQNSSYSSNLCQSSATIIFICLFALFPKQVFSVQFRQPLNSLCSPSWPQTHRDPSGVQGLKQHAGIPGLQLEVLNLSLYCQRDTFYCILPCL